MKKIFLLLALMISACGAAPTSNNEGDIPPTGRNGGTMFPIQFPEPAGLNVKPGYNGIYYHGGPILLGNVNVYYIWYGNWGNDTTPSVLDNLAKNIGCSPYFKINSTYYDSNKNHVSDIVSYAGSTTDNYSQGTALNDTAVYNIVSKALISNALPTDSNGVYFVLSSADVDETSGFCSKYCGWHLNGIINGHDIKYAFVGNPSRCPSSCEAQAISPNNNPVADAMASIVAHELEESITDPDLTGWYDKRGLENADKCSWTFGTEYIVANGSRANMNLGGMDYLIQRNWVNASGGYCALSY